MSHIIYIYIYTHNMKYVFFLIQRHTHTDVHLLGLQEIRSNGFVNFFEHLDPG